MDAKILAEQFNLRHKKTDKNISELKEQLNGIEKIIKGNGEPGMRTDVSKNTDFRKSTQDNLRKIFFMVAGQFLAIIISAAFIMVAISNMSQ